jgi:hypothetical protein
MGGGSEVVLEGWDEGIAPTTMGRQTEGGRAASGEGEAEDVVDVDASAPIASAVEKEGAPDTDKEVDPGPGEVAGTTPPAGVVDPIRIGSTGSAFGKCTAASEPTPPSTTPLGTVVNGPPCTKPPFGCPGGDPDPDIDVEGNANGADVNGGGSGPIFTLRLSGGSSGIALSFFLEPFPVPSLPPGNGGADWDEDWA